MCWRHWWFSVRRLRKRIVIVTSPASDISMKVWSKAALRRILQPSMLFSLLIVQTLNSVHFFTIYCCDCSISSSCTQVPMVFAGHITIFLGCLIAVAADFHVSMGTISTFDVPEVSCTAQQYDDVTWTKIRNSFPNMNNASSNISMFHINNATKT
ncbi:uncharacterized protein [Periplaneta americana]|uniref:uncharacterized protein isoform X2 n=1 Tax=Periplaneta americana TaxID=6978 RepID=UPI0037E6FEE5